MHRASTFKNVDEYSKQFTNEYLTAYLNKPKKEQFAYLYYERLAAYQELDDIDEDGAWNQIVAMRCELEDQLGSKIISNQTQAITWYVHDQDSYTPPCLQRIWLRPDPRSLVLDVHLSWRSRDAFGAWQANLVALTRMINKEIAEPNNCVIGRIIDMNDSLHVYNTDLGAARTISGNPMNH